MALKTRYNAGVAGATLLAALSTTGSAAAQAAPIVQPRAPGEAARRLSAEEAAQIAANRYSEADVRFMQDMILHHFQAVQMAEPAARPRHLRAVLVPGRDQRYGL
ncbi:MAG: DUF305 domain-containing protein, partial [Oceanicaulis sp.]